MSVLILVKICYACAKPLDGSKIFDHLVDLMPVLAPYEPPSWYSAKGAYAKYKKMERRGLPSFKDWRFITLTLDPKLFSDEKSAYEIGKDRLRYFMRCLRSYLGVDDLPYCWKLEFQKNGWAHWHLLIDYRKKIPHQDLVKFWSLGWIDIKRSKHSSLAYLFKYVCKSVNDLPNWFLGYARPRIFQSRGIFALNDKESTGSPGDETGCKDPSSSLPKSNGGGGELLGVRLKRWASSVHMWRDKEQISKHGVMYQQIYPEMVKVSKTWWPMLTAWLNKNPQSVHFVDGRSDQIHVTDRMLMQVVEEKAK